MSNDNTPDIYEIPMNDALEMALANQEVDHMEQMPCENDENEEHDPFLSDCEADEDAMTSAGMGENESYNGWCDE